VLGAGANTLVNENGVQGIVVKPAFNVFEVIEKGEKEIFVRVGAGISVSSLIQRSFEQGAYGLEEFGAIPGSVGGSVYNNLHYFEHSFSDFVVGAQVFEKATGTIIEVDSEWFAFGYDYSTLHAKKHIVISVTFKLHAGDPVAIAYARGRLVEIIRHRLKRYPHSHTCGCFFRNFHENEVELEVNNKKMIYVGYYFDQLGLKGTLRIGDAMVSAQHANMIINCGNATTDDILAVARTMQEKVFAAYGIMPQPECELLGFAEYPLLK